MSRPSLVGEKDKYVLAVSYGVGMTYLTEPTMDKLTRASAVARAEQSRLAASKSKRAPKVTVSVLRVVEVYDGSRG